MKTKHFHPKPRLNTDARRRLLTCLTALVLCLISTPTVLGLGADGGGNSGGSLTNNSPSPLPLPDGSAGPMVDGYLDARYGAPLVLQTVQTGFGDNLSELDALYAVVVSNDLYLFIAGNVENNYNKLNIFIDSVPGGQQTIDAAQNPNNDDWARRHHGFTFDEGFDADFAFNFRQGSSPGAPPAFLDFTVVGGETRDFDQYANPFTSGRNTGHGTTAPGVHLGYIFELGFNNSNTGGVTFGSGTADQVAARNVSTGFELRIPLAAIGQPPPGSRIRLVAMVNGRYHDFLSNQILPGFVPPQGNLGGDGFGNFTGDVGAIDLRDFAGRQFAELVIPDDSLIQRWTRTSAPVADWSAAACSADGTKLVAAVQNGSIYTSADAGRTWIPTSAPAEAWSTVASSADGNTLVAAGYPGPVYVSRDAGATWTQTPAPPHFYWAWVACSADGSKITAVPYYEYSPTSASQAVAENEDGGVIAAISGEDGGIVLPDGIFLPPDFEFPPIFFPPAPKPIYLSSDAGTSWTTRQPLGHSVPYYIAFFWTSAAMSEDGSRIAVTGVEYNSLQPSLGWYGHVYTSQNAGSSWQGSLLYSFPWNWVAMSGDGMDMLIAGGIEATSSDGGASWYKSYLSPGAWLSVAISADGTRMTAAEWPNPLYPGRLASSVDSGATWTVDNAPYTTWNGVAMSADGSLAVAPAYQGGIWVSRLTPVIWCHPIGAHVNEGEVVQFSVEAESSIGPYFQWLFDGTAIPGATNASLVLTDVQHDQAGVYAVIVSNRLGSAASSNAILQVNRYPVAHATAAPNPAVSGNGTDATVVLDGSQSSDPDGDVLTHTWYGIPQSGGSTSLVEVATGEVVVTSLPVGINVLWLTVDDGMARDTDSVTVEVITTAQAVDRLISLVNESDLAHKQPLLATLRAALASIQRGSWNSAVGQLHALQNKVRAQVSPEDLILAMGLINGAGQVVEALGGDGTSRVAGKIHSFKQHLNGKMRLGFSGLVGGACIVEASTNLVDWEAIGVATVSGDGLFEFEDPDAAKHPCRFYRVVTPQ